MPLTTEDLAAALDRQHHEEFEAHILEVERHRQEIERLEAALAAAKSTTDAK
jgi:arginyl-tRNA synthetase